MTPMPTRTLRSRITTAMLLVSIIPLALFMAATEYQQQHRSLQQAESRLTTLGLLKQREVEIWLQGAVAELRQLARHPMVNDTALTTEARATFLAGAGSASLFFDHLQVVPTRQGPTERTPALTWAALPESRPVLTLYQVIEAHPDQLLQGDVDLVQTLLRQFSDGTNPGEQAAAWLVDRQGRILRAAVDTGSDIPYPSQAMRSQASKREGGLVQGMDRKGRAALAYILPLQHLPLSLVYIQNRAAALTPLKPFGSLALVIGLLSLLVIAAAGASLSRSLARPIRELTEVLQRRPTEKEVPPLENIPVDTHEMALLIRAFDHMEGTVQHKLQAESALAGLSADLVPIRDVDQWTNRAATIAATHCDADFAVVYQSRPDGTWQPVAAVGADLATLPRYNADSGEGELGKLLASGKDLLEVRLPIQGKTVTGSVAPATILAMPLRHEHTVTGFLALGFYREPAPWVTHMLQVAGAPFSAALSRILYTEEIRNLASELEQQNSELEIQARELEQQATELEAQNLELDRQRHELETADRYKSEFISTMSHELRTPLNAIISLSRLLLEQSDIDSDRQRDYLAVIARNGKQLLRLINDILDLSRIEAGRLTLTRSIVQVAPLLSSTADMCRPLVGEKPITVTVNVPNDLPDIVSDAGRLQQILINLTGNAIKFTESGTVTLQAEADHTHLQIHVRDTGVGIPPEQLQAIFEPFHQANGSTRRRYQGTGLGLAISRKLAHALGGNLTAVSTPGTGSTFTLTLPLQLPDEIADATASAPDISGDTDSAFDAAEGAAGGHLLLVEDNEVARIQVTEVLKRAGYRITSVASAEEALGAVRKQVPDGLILDLMMPGMDGFDLLEQIRSREETASLPVLILTAKDLTPEDRGRLSANHVQQLIQKGDVNRRELLFKVRRMLTPDTSADENTDQGSGKPSTRRPVALLIEDNPDNVTVLEAMLSPYLTVHTAPDGETGIDILNRNHVDVVLLDIMMPGMDGFQVARKIRARHGKAALPIIAVSAMATDRERNMILRAGCNAHVPKPVDRRQLLETIARWVPMERTSP